MNRAFNSGEKFRELLRSKDFLVLAGAHSGLSAKIAERSGFDGIWASSFEMSALFGLPDSNILSFKDTYDLVKGMLYVTDIPVIVDCDNGYGNAVNVIRTVREYDSLGVAGICIEDNTFPKKCSFYNSKKRELESSKDFSNKISAAKDAQIDKSFFVIARTESFIAGLGLEEALSR
ncbi:MAG: isocitrate lyase/PEP mutase family protein, partial [Nitrosopumilaceae archaeon]